MAIVIGIFDVIAKIEIHHLCKLLLSGQHGSWVTTWWQADKRMGSEASVFRIRCYPFSMKRWKYEPNCDIIRYYKSILINGWFLLYTCGSQPPITPALNPSKDKKRKILPLKRSYKAKSYLKKSEKTFRKPQHELTQVKIQIKSYILFTFNHKSV